MQPMKLLLEVIKRLMECILKDILGAPNSEMDHTLFAMINIKLIVTFIPSNPHILRYINLNSINQKPIYVFILQMPYF